jgi:hypothetical protein
MKTRIEFIDKPVFQDLQNSSTKRGAGKREAHICINFISKTRCNKINWASKGKDDQEALKKALDEAVNIFGPVNFKAVDVFSTNGTTELKKVKGNLPKVCKRLIEMTKESDDEK